MLLKINKSVKKSSLKSFKKMKNQILKKKKIVKKNEKIKKLFKMEYFCKCGVFYRTLYSSS